MFNGFGGSGISLADIAAVTRNGGFGDNGSGWWVLIVLLALCGGFGDGNGNFGGGRQNGVATVDAAVQRGFDTQSIMGSLRGIEQGLCSLGYDQLSQMNNLSTTVMQSNFGLQSAITQLGYQMQNCCCENRQGQADIKYTMAKDTCDITTAIERAAQSIIQNDNANYRQMHDEIVDLRIQDMRDQLSQKDALINNLNLGISQRNQTDAIAERVLTMLKNGNYCLN